MAQSLSRMSPAQFLCIALAAASTATLQASDMPQTASPAVLVELFTSEGCSSCPPADRLLLELDRKQPVAGTTIVVLSEHVDYWDHDGWRDPFSSPHWTDRQDQYARQFNLNGPYTPQIVVNGSRQVNGSDSRAVRSAIEEAAKNSQLPISISSLERLSDGVHVQLTAGLSKGATLYAVLADDADRSSVQSGENAGRTIDHVAVARSLVRVAKLEKPLLDEPLLIPIPAGSRDRRLRLIVFAQDGHSGQIVGVAAREL